MIRILLVTSLLILTRVSLAGCVPTYGKAFIETISIKNSTSDTLTISGDCNSSDGNEIKSGYSKEFSRVFCPGDTLNTTQCIATNPTGNTATLTVTYGSCTSNITHTVSSDTLNPFACSYTYHVATTNERRCTYGSSYMGTYQTSYFDIADKNPSYTIEWNNLTMTLTKGQAMGKKLASLLLKNIQYTDANVLYDGNSLRVTLKYLPNPYKNCTDGDSCKAVNIASL